MVLVPRLRVGRREGGRERKARMAFIPLIDRLVDA
jgi:hypothetical protein